MTTDIEKAYAAGLIDGEGCIGMYNTRPKQDTRAAYFQITVRVTMRESEAILFLHKTFGGALTISRFTRKNRVDVYPAWQVRNRQAEDFLVQVLPYLRIKKAQAELVLAFGELRRSTRASMPRSERYSDEVLAMYGNYVQKLKDMKRPAVNTKPI